VKGGYILFNGRFFRESDTLFTGSDLFRLNAGIRGAFRSENNLVMFAEENFNYLINSLLAIGLPPPAHWDLARFKSDVSRLLNKNHLFLAAKVVIHLIPGPSGTDYLLAAEEVIPGFFPLNDSGLLIDFYEEGTKSSAVASAYEPPSRYLWSAATRSAIASDRNNLIISNNQGFACESIGGTFGCLISKTAVFPSPESHGFSPPILGVVMECAELCGYQILEKNEISHEELLNADELFLIDNYLGIQPVLGLGNRRYYMSATIPVALKLSETARREHPSV
jgi:branched-chain amino acid aminotransferase